MGLTKLLKGKPLTDEEKEHRKQVEEAERKAQWAEELKLAEERGKAKAHKKGKGGLLATIGAAAEGALVGVNKGAKVFNDSMGSNDFTIPKQEDILSAPKGNNDSLILPKNYGSSDIFYGSSPRKSKKKYIEEQDDSNYF